MKTEDTTKGKNIEQEMAHLIESSQKRIKELGFIRLQEVILTQLQTT